MIETMRLQSRRFTQRDFQETKSYARITSFPRARSAEAKKTPMTSGREEPDAIALLRPLALSVMPAHGAAGAQGSSEAWSVAANASDPENDEEDALDTSPLPAEKKMKKLVVLRGFDEPQVQTEALRPRLQIEDFRRGCID